jgi:sphingolipid delta-4 desaturase
MTNPEFIFSQGADPHIQRRKDMLKKYPVQIRALMGNHPGTAFWIVLAVVSQFAAAYLLRDQGMGWVILSAFVFGAVINHALYVFIHEATHNLVFKNSLWNRAIAMFCDFALFAPGSMAFRKYHLIHHNRQGQHDFDADLVSETEANLVGNHWFKKLIWVFLMAVSQAARPNRLKIKPFWRDGTGVSIRGRDGFDLPWTLYLVWTGSSSTRRPLDCRALRDPRRPRDLLLLWTA